MNSWKRAALVALIAALASVAAAGTASASREFNFSERVIVFLWETMTLGSPETEAPVECRVNLILSLTNRNVWKMAEITMGTSGMRVLRAEACRNGIATLLGEGTQRAPTLYQGFGGGLPNITSMNVDIQRVEFLLSYGGGLFRCLYEGTLRMIITIAGGRVASGTITESANMRLKTTLEGSAGCPMLAAITGRTTSVTPAATVRLV
ncbi:MAG: hypothetical protein WBC33_09530 [Conexibacter sp.]